MTAVDEIVEKHATKWLHAGYGHYTIELMVALMRRAAEGMSDKELIGYMGYRTRKAILAGQQDHAALVLRDLRTPTSDLYAGIQEIRALLEEAEKNRKEVLVPVPLELECLMIEQLWREEIRDKRAMLPPGKGRGASRSRRRRGGGGGAPRKPSLRDMANRLDVSEDMAWKKAAARRKKTPPNRQP